MVIIIVTLLFTLALSSMAVTTRMQVNKTDHRNKATDLAEMGITYYQSLLAKQVKSANKIAQQKPDNYDRVFCEEIKKKPELQSGYTKLNTVETGDEYEVVFQNLKGSCDQGDKLEVNFSSYGKTEGESVKLNGTIAIENKNGTGKIGETAPGPSSYTIQENNAVELESKNKDETYGSSTYFKQYVHIQGNRTLTVNGAVFFYGRLSFKGSADIFIHGDAIFKEKIDIPNGKPYNLCIQGDTYLVDSNNRLIDYDLPQNSCVKPATSEWSIDKDSGVTVKY